MRKHRELDCIQLSAGVPGKITSYLHVYMYIFGEICYAVYIVQLQTYMYVPSPMYIYVHVYTCICNCIHYYSNYVTL